MDDVTGNLFSLFCSTWHVVLKMFVRLFRIEASENFRKRHFDVICDLLLNRHTATWNLFVKYIYYTCITLMDTF